MHSTFTKLAPALGMMLAAAWPVAAQTEPAPAPAPVLRYAPALDQVDTGKLQVRISDLLLSGTPTGMTGAADAENQISVTAVEEAGTSLKLEITRLQQQMAGHALPSTCPEPTALQVDERARLIGTPTVEAQVQGDVLSQGGLPVQVLVLLCALPQLPDGPVAAGESWQRTDTYQLPGLGPAKLQSASTFGNVTEGIATISSNLRVSVPDFEADNPLLPGQKVKVRNLVVEISELVQEYNLERSVVRRAGGSLRASLEATSPDLTLPVKLVAKITYESPRP